MQRGRSRRRIYAKSMHLPCGTLKRLRPGAAGPSERTRRRACGRAAGLPPAHRQHGHESGNLGLLVALEDLARGRFTLAPVYDMLPMRWRPDAALGGAPDYAPFEPDQASVSSPAAGPARDFWVELEAHPHVGAPLKAVAAEMARRIAAAQPPKPQRPVRRVRA